MNYESDDESELIGCLAIACVRAPCLDKAPNYSATPHSSYNKFDSVEMEDMLQKDRCLNFEVRVLTYAFSML